MPPSPSVATPHPAAIARSLRRASFPTPYGRHPLSSGEGLDSAQPAWGTSSSSSLAAAFNGFSFTGRSKNIGT